RQCPRGGGGRRQGGVRLRAPHHQVLPGGGAVDSQCGNLSVRQRQGARLRPRQPRQAGGQARQRIRRCRYAGGAPLHQEGAKALRRADSRPPPQLHRPAHPGPVHGAHPGGWRRCRAAPRGPAALPHPGEKNLGDHRRPRPGGDEARFPGGELLPGGWQQGHLDRRHGEELTMLSRVAERLYWTSRYLERVENTARLMGVYTNLLLDMPSGVNIDWYNLVTLNNAEAWFENRYKVKDERNVMRFLLSDPDYPGAMLSSLQGVRENIRTTRDVVPAESWEYINELTL